MSARSPLASITPDQREALIAACGANLSKRLPMLYCVVLVNIAVLAASFAGSAPTWLTVGLPALFIAGVLWRIAYWLPSRASARSPVQVRRSVEVLPLAGAFLALALAGWALTLYGYGNETQQGLVHYVTAITCFTGVLGMTHSAATAAVIAIAVMVPSSIVFLHGNHANGLAIVVLQAVISVLLLLVTRGHNRDFVNLELSRLDLAGRERDSSELAERNRLYAIRDSLTGAMNRRGILDLFAETLARPPSELPWLGLIDLDGFKLINDTYGHAAGDEVLCAVSKRLGACQRITAYGRLGGDEFAILLASHYTKLGAREVLEELAEAIAQPIPFGEQMLTIRASIGLHRCAGSDVSACLERADLALYKAKETRNATIGEFTVADERAMHEKHAITRVFTSTNFEDQLSLVYQPIIDCNANRTIGFEALSRWSPDGIEWLPPLDFIHLAEATGRMGELTARILTKALTECPAWRHGCSLNVNLSARDILREDAAPWIAGLVRAAKAPAEWIIFEITETALVNDYRRAADNLARLRELGFRIALDDFGTGQSSLSHVHNLPLDHIKIDQGFARDMAGSDNARAVVGTIVALARQLRLECIIEGIETAEQQVIARTLGVRMMQGYHFSRPMSAHKAIGGMTDFDRLAIAG